MLRRAAMLLAVLGCITAFGVAGCGSSSSSSTAGAGSGGAATQSTPTTHFAKTKFVFHLGLAGGAFHRYIYKPFKAGAFGKPASHKLALFKAAIAALFTYHELKLAAHDVKSSKILSALFSPITALASKVSALRAQLLGGKYSPAGINEIQAGGGAVIGAASAKGYQVPDITPTAAQVAAG